MLLGGEEAAGWLGRLWWKPPLSGSSKTGHGSSLSEAGNRLWTRIATDVRRISGLRGRQGRTQRDYRLRNGRSAPVVDVDVSDVQVSPDSRQRRRRVAIRGRRQTGARKHWKRWIMLRVSAPGAWPCGCKLRHVPELHFEQDKNPDCGEPRGHSAAKRAKKIVDGPLHENKPFQNSNNL